MKKWYYFGIIVTVLVLGLWACNKEYTAPQNKANEMIVDVQQAQNLAQRFIQSKTMLKSQKEKKVKSQKTFKDSQGVDAMYVFNYEEGGFTIVSGDKRVEPILAYDEKNEFSFDDVSCCVADWQNFTIAAIDTLRHQNMKQTDKVKKQWETYLIPYPDDGGTGGGSGTGGGTGGSTGEGTDCSTINYSFSVGPILRTTWGQRCWYNANCPEKNCSELNCTGNTDCNTRAVTGCVATALAQVINHHQQPASRYNFSILLNRYFGFTVNPSGGAEIARLMRDCGEAVSTDYGCKGSTGWSPYTDDALIEDFGYSTDTKRTDFAGHSGDLQMNLRNNRPVILEGSSNFTGMSGHEWVCDGYFEERTPCYTYLYLHMNWGWDSLSDGWFVVGDWSVDEHNYNYYKKMTYNIHP